MTRSKLPADTDVLIIGGGLAGLACAVGLIGSGLRITLVEAAPVLGGRARSGLDERTGDRIDIGPHVILTEYRNFLSFLGMLGTADRVVWQTDKLVTLLSACGMTEVRAASLPPPLHLLPGMLSARDVSLADQVSNVRAILFGMRFHESDVDTFDRLPAEELLHRLGVSERFIDWFWRTASLALMNVPLEACSSGALMRFFAHFLGSARARFGFPGCSLDELYAPAARSVIEASGGVICERREVDSLTHAGATCTGARLRGGETIRSRFCVAAVPPGALSRFLPEAWREEPPFGTLHRFVPSPYISTCLWFDRKLTRERFWAKVWTPAGVSCDFYDLSNIRHGWSARGSVIASNIIYSHRVQHLDDDEIVRVTLREIGELPRGLRGAQPIHQHVQRIPMAIPSPYPGTERLRPSTLTSFARLLLAGDWTRTELPCCMESAVRSGFLAAERILADVAKPRALARPPPSPHGLAGLMNRLSRPRRLPELMP
jgi:uncharacterized protein with NAD-binding domain and iron-sulfur cluster